MQIRFLSIFIRFLYLLFQERLAYDRPGYQKTSTTLFRQREEVCAGVIQRAWRKRKEGRADDIGGDNIDEDNTGRDDIGGDINDGDDFGDDINVTLEEVYTTDTNI